MKKHLKWMLAGLLLTAAAGVSPAAEATTAVLISRENLVDRSTVVARVKVGKAVTTVSDDGTAIVTRTEVTVTQLLKGSAPATFVIEQIGGTFKGKTQKLTGDAILRAGEDAVLFVRNVAPTTPGAPMFLTALAMSVYHVDAKGLVFRDLDDLTLVERKDGRLQPVEPPHEAGETVEHLMTDVVRIAGATK